MALVRKTSIWASKSHKTNKMYTYLYREWNPISLPFRNSGLLAKDFSFLQCCAWSIQRSTSGRPASCTSAAPAPAPNFTLSFFRPAPFQHAALWEIVINHNYLWLWQSPSHSSAHSVALSSLTALHPRLPSRPFPLFSSCSTLQEINVAVRPFIYLEHRRRWEGTWRAADIFG